MTDEAAPAGWRGTLAGVKRNWKGWLLVAPFLLALLLWIITTPPPLPDHDGVVKAWKPSESWVYDRNGELLDSARIDFHARRLAWVPLDQISPDLVTMLVSAEDKRFRELVETRNRADALLHATDKSVKDLGDKVTGEERAAIEAALSDLRGVLKGDDKAAIEHKAEALAKVSAPVVQRAYQGEAQAAGAAPDASARAGAGPGKDDVLDAEFEEIKDKGPKSH